jgi:hypothetical protein
MDLEAYREKMARAGPHPGLSQWHKSTVLLFRCRDITAQEFRRRFTVLAAKFEKLLEESLPENLELETYQMASGYYNAVAECLDSYLEGIDEVLYWSDSGDEKALEASKRCFVRADREWNKALQEALDTERQFQEMDEALLRSLGAAGY